MVLFERHDEDVNIVGLILMYVLEVVLNSIEFNFLTSLSSRLSNKPLALLGHGRCYERFPKLKLSFEHFL